MVDGWQDKLPKACVYQAGKADRAVIDKVFDKLHDNGKMEYTKTHTSSGYPVFVVWKPAWLPDSTEYRKGACLLTSEATTPSSSQIYTPFHTKKRSSR